MGAQLASVVEGAENDGGRTFAKAHPRCRNMLRGHWRSRARRQWSGRRRSRLWSTTLVLQAPLNVIMWVVPSPTRRIWSLGSKGIVGRADCGFWFFLAGSLARSICCRLTLRLLGLSSDDFLVFAIFPDFTGFRSRIALRIAFLRAPIFGTRCLVTTVKVYRRSCGEPCRKLKIDCLRVTAKATSR